MENVSAKPQTRHHCNGLLSRPDRSVPTLVGVVCNRPRAAGDHPFRGDRAPDIPAELVGLDHRLEHYPGQLSGGEQQRVALARAFAPEPDLLLADEPTGNLDGETGEQVIELLFDLQAHHGTTLLLVTHNSGLAARCARRVELFDGYIRGDRPAGGGPETG